MNAVPDAWRHNEPAPVAAPREVNALGIDVASYQGNPNWSQVAATRQFVYVKAGQGAGTSYATLDPQYQGAVAAGLAVGLYWFADPALAPEANADAFAVQVNRLGAINGHLPPCLDLETGTGNLAQWTQRFITRLRAQTGCVRTMIYSGASFFQNQIGEAGLDQNVALWIASWGTPPGQPSYNSPRVALHQYSSQGQVAGVSGNVDLNYAIWSLNSIIPGVAPSPVVTPPAITPPAATTVSVLTPDEQAKLTAAYQQFSGSPTVGQWPGWPALPGGSAGKSYTLVDWCRYIDVQNVALKAELDAIKAQAALTPSGTAAALSDADKQAIALAVVTMLTQRLAS